MNKLKIISCTLIVCGIMYLMVPRAFSWNPLVTMVKTISLIKNYQ
jgi:hypothetical protein